MGRQAPKEVNHEPTSGKKKKKEEVAVKKEPVDARSETIVGMTFARAMGIDSTEHKPKGQKRDAIFKEQVRAMVTRRCATKGAIDYPQLDSLR